MRNRNNSTDNAFMEFIKKYWMWIAGLFILYPYIVAFMRRKNLQDDVKASADEIIRLEAVNANPVTQNSELQNITTNTSHHNIARDIYHHTGYMYPWWDPRRWTENDEAIFLLLRNFNPIPNSIIESYYVISTGRNLRTDLQAVLDTQYYRQLKW